MGKRENTSSNEIPHSISCDTPCCTIKDILFIDFSQPIIKACPIKNSCLCRSVYIFGYITFNWHVRQYEPCPIFF